MSENKKVIPVALINKTVELIVFGEVNKSIEPTIIEKSDAIENGEATFQIKEGCFYEYKIDDGYSLETFGYYKPIKSQSFFRSHFAKHLCRHASYKYFRICN